MLWIERLRSSSEGGQKRIIKNLQLCEKINEKLRRRKEMTNNTERGREGYGFVIVAGDKIKAFFRVAN